MFMEQHLSFEGFTHPQHVYKLRQDLYWYKQAPNAKYEKLTSFLSAQDQLSFSQAASSSLGKEVCISQT